MWLDLGEYRGPSRFHAFLCYCVARFQHRQEKKAYRLYVTESLRMAPQGKYLTQSFDDMIRPHEEIDVEATIEHVIEGLG